MTWSVEYQTPSINKNDFEKRNSGLEVESQFQGGYLRIILVYLSMWKSWRNTGPNQLVHQQLHWSQWMRALHGRRVFRIYFCEANTPILRSHMHVIDTHKFWSSLGRFRLFLVCRLQGRLVSSIDKITVETYKIHDQLQYDILALKNSEYT